MEKKLIYRWTYNLIVLALLLIGATVVIINFAHFGNVEWTDNAHVRQHIKLDAYIHYVSITT